MRQLVGRRRRRRVVRLLLVLVLLVVAVTAETYYDVLGVSSDVAAGKLKPAYRRMALKWHPDKHVQDAEEAAARIVRINTAFEVLSDRVKRARYDWLLEQGITEYDDKRDWTEWDRTGGYKFAPGGRRSQASAMGFNRHTDTVPIVVEAEPMTWRDAVSLWGSLIGATLVALVPAWYSWRAKKEKKRSRKRLVLPPSFAESMADIELTEQEKMLNVSQFDLDRASPEELERICAILKYQEEHDIFFSDDDDDDNDDDDDDKDKAADRNEESKGGQQTVQPNDAGPENDGDEGGSSVASEDTQATADEEKQEKKQHARWGPFDCALCNKKYKSSSQLENHEASSKHQKAVKQAERAKQKAKKNK